jgi:casein kinase 1
MLIHLLTPGGLPWTRNGVPRDDTAHTRLKREKRDATPETLCAGMPPEFAEFLHYCRGLAFAARPDYEVWKRRFEECALEHGFGDVEPFLWPPPPISISVSIIFTN